MEEKNTFKLARQKAGNKPLEIVAKESGISKNTIWKLERGLVDAGYTVVRRLADYYQVNAAWLMGQKNTSPSLDESIQTVTKTTGLSQKAIANLQTITDEDEKQALNHLLEIDSFKTIITWLSLAENMVQRETSICRVESWEEKREIESHYDDNFNVEMKLSPKESARYFLSRATQTAQDILTLLIAEQWKDKIHEWVKDTIKGAKKNGKH